MAEGFPPDEMVFFKGAPYFPVGKIAELLNFDEGYIDDILFENPYIIERAIKVEEVETSVMGMYFDLIGCLEIGLKCNHIKVGLWCKYWIFRVIGALSNNNVGRLSRIYERKNVHKYVKGLLKYFVPSSEENYEFKFREPVQ
jgi:hypothetical protein